MPRPIDPDPSAEPREVVGRRGVGKTVALLAALAFVAFSLFALLDDGGVVGSASGDALLQQAQDAFRNGQHDRARALLGRLADERAPTPMDRLLRAQVALATDQNVEARDELDRIPANHPIAPIARLMQGQVEVKLDHLQAAEAAFLDAIRLEPKFVQARRELTFIYSIQRRLPELDEQLAALSELGEMPPSYVLYWTRVRNGIWNAEKDLPRLQRFVAGDPDDRWSRLSLAEGLRRSGDLVEAERVLAPLPEADAEAVALRAWLAIDRGDHAAAQAILAAGPADHPSVARLRAELAMARGDAESALADLRIAERADPSDRRVLFAIGRALSTLGRDDEARPYLDKVRAHDELHQLASKAAAMATIDDAPLCVEIGTRCLALGRTAEARAWFHAALAIDPFFDEAQRALSRMEAGDGPGPSGPPPDPS